VQPFMIVVVSLIVVVILITGVWRPLLLRRFVIKPQDMTPEALGFDVSEPADVERINGICRAFSSGFNTMLVARSADSWTRNTDETAVFYRPFADEGAAMGFSARRLGLCSPASFESNIVQPSSQFRYLHYVGLGFYHAMRKTDPARLATVIRTLDPLLGSLCWDGYGFKTGFFDFDRLGIDGIRERFSKVKGYPRNIAHQGLGRSLWFRYMGNPQKLRETVAQFDDYANDVASGVGLAVVFTMIDRPQRVEAILRTLPDKWQNHVMLGMTFAFKARAVADPVAYKNWLVAFEDDARITVNWAVDRCDQIEQTLRDGDPVADGYRVWRDRLRAWLGENVAFPLTNVLHGDRRERDATILTCQQTG
jgi:enediyne biosynthesis protein E3